MALIGNRGAGKSTIACLVQLHVYNGSSTAPRIIFCRVSLWPFQSVEAAIHGILDRLIQELSRHVETLPLLGIPKEYVEIVGQSKGLWAQIVGIVHHERTPESVLRQVHEAAEAVGLRLVLWIEDLERFEPWSGSGDPTRVQEHFAPIRSLLYLLDKCPSVTVVLATDSLEGLLDAEKTARFVEHTPRLEPEATWAILGKFRSHTFESSMRTRIDPAGREVRQELAPPPDPRLAAFWLSENPGSPRSARVAMVKLLNTPRLIKQALRLSLETWDFLAGEVDFDDVLMISAIRSARPDVYAFVDRNIDRFRSQKYKDKTINVEDWQTQNSQFDQRLQEVVDKDLDVDRTEAVRFLLSCVFQGEESVAGSKSKPQGLGRGGPRDYWQRYSALPRVLEDESDQFILRKMEEWKSHRTSSAAGCLLDTSHRPALSAFRFQLGPDDLVDLLEPATEQLAQLDAENLEFFHAPLVELRGIMSSFDIRPSALEATVIRLIGRYAPVHIPLAYTVLSWFASPSRGHLPALLDSEGIDRARLAFGSCLIDTFSSFPGDLAVAIRDAPPGMLAWCANAIWPLVDGERIRQADWRTFMNCALLGAEARRKALLPQVLGFFCSERHIYPGGPPRLETQVVVDLALARELFETSRLDKLFAPDAPDPEWNHETSRRYSAVRARLQST